MPRLLSYLELCNLDSSTVCVHLLSLTMLHATRPLFSTVMLNCSFDGDITVMWPVDTLLHILSIHSFSSWSVIFF